MATLLCQHAGIVGSAYDSTNSSVVVSVKGDGVLTYAISDQVESRSSFQPRREDLGENNKLTDSCIVP